MLLDESKKALLGLTMIVSAMGCSFVFSDGMSGTTARAVWSATLGVSTLWLIWLMCRRDRFPDHLAEVTKPYFDARGLAFAVVPQFNEAGDYCWSIFYQNQYDSPCVAELALLPSKGMKSLKSRLGKKSYRVPIKAGPAEFGVVRLAVSFTPKEAGNDVVLNYGATVQRPLGKGKKVRFRDGHAIKRKAKSARAESSGCLLSLLALPFGMLYIKGSGAVTKLRLPAGAALAASPEREGTYESETLWAPDPMPAPEEVFAV